MHVQWLIHLLQSAGSLPKYFVDSTCKHWLECWLPISLLLCQHLHQIFLLFLLDKVKIHVLLKITCSQIRERNNLLVTRQCKGHIGEWWPEGMVIPTEHSKVCTKMTEGQCYPVWLEQAICTCRLASCLLRPLLCPLLKAKICTAYDGNHPYGKILTKSEPIKIWKKLLHLPHSQLTKMNRELLTNTPY